MQRLTISDNLKYSYIPRVAESKKKTKLKTTLKSSSKKNKKSTIKKRYTEDYHHKYYVLKDSIALLFLFLAFFSFIPLNLQTNFALFGLAMFAFLISFVSFIVIGEYLYKTAKLQEEKKVEHFTTTIFTNGIFGFIFPLMIINYCIFKAATFLSNIDKADTFWCDLRTAIVNIYFQDGFPLQSSIYANFNSFILYTAILFVAFFLFGNLYERYKK